MVGSFSLQIVWMVRFPFQGNSFAGCPRSRCPRSSGWALVRKIPYLQIVKPGALTSRSRPRLRRSWRGASSGAPRAMPGIWGQTSPMSGIPSVSTRVRLKNYRARATRRFGGLCFDVLRVKGPCWGTFFDPRHGRSPLLAKCSMTKVVIQCLGANKGTLFL